MENDALKICPFCKEQIRKEAVKCRYCGEWLEEKARNVAAKNSKVHTTPEITPAPSADAAPQTSSSSGLAIENPAQDFYSKVQTPPIRLAYPTATGEAESANSMKAVGRALDEKCASLFQPPLRGVQVTDGSPQAPAQRASMNCPTCKLINPPEALRCDCGYDFSTRTVERAYSQPVEPAQIKVGRKCLIVFTAAVIATITIQCFKGAPPSIPKEKLDWLKTSNDPILQWARQDPKVWEDKFHATPGHETAFRIGQVMGEFLGPVAVLFGIAMLFAGFVRGSAGVVVGVLVVVFVATLEWEGQKFNIQRSNSQHQIMPSALRR